MLEMRGVCKALAGRPVLRGVDLTVPAGRTLVIVGGSGTGKSVTLQHFAGLLQPDRGEVLIDGQNIAGAGQRKLEAMRSRFGVLFQSGALINWMSVFDNVALPLYEKTDLGDAEIAERVRQKLAMVELEGAEYKMPAELSGGMRKRAGLARAIVRDPSIMLYDEPNSGLDPIMSRSIDRLILDLQSRLSGTAIVVTHDLTSAFTVGDEIALLDNGRIVESAPPDVFVRSRHPLVRRFVEAQFGSERKGEHHVR